jgi:hypothetical protein
MAAVVMLTVGTTTVAHAEFEGRPPINNAFAPTGYTLNRGEVVLGFGPIAFGINDNVQLGTNMLLWAFQIYNADLKISPVKSDHLGVAIGVRAARVPVDFADEKDVPFRSLAPYVTISPRIGPNTVAHLSGRLGLYESTDSDRSVEDAEISVLNIGRMLSAGIEHGMSDRTKLIADVGYDDTFKTWRMSGGALFGWQTFRLKMGLHYIPDENDGTVVPMIGFRWRFQG